MSRRFHSAACMVPTAGTAVVSKSVVEPTGRGLDPAIGRTGAVGSCAACLPTEITKMLFLKTVCITERLTRRAR
jgi:hypothetical protein